MDIHIKKFTTERYQNAPSIIVGRASGWEVLQGRVDG